MVVNKKDFQLANGEIISVGMNFYALELMTQYPGGLGKLSEQFAAMQEQEEDKDSADQLSLAPEAFHALSYLLYALIRAGGARCTQEEAAMAIGLDDFPKLIEIFNEFTEAADKMTPSKNAKRRVTSTSRR